MAASSSNLPVNFGLRNFPKKELSVLRRLLLSGNEPSRIQKLQLGYEFRVVHQHLVSILTFMIAICYPCYSVCRLHC